MPAPLLAVDLARGDWQVRVLPALGGALASASWRGQPVLRPSAEEALQQGLVRRSACYPLLPFSNRIADAAFSFEGRAYVLTANFDNEPHAIHGLGFQRPWQVRSSSAETVTMQLEHASPAAGEWPFALRATQVVTLEGDDLVLQLEVENLDQRRAPCGLGWHPFFPLISAAQPTQLQTHWQAMLLNGPDKLPCGSVPPPDTRHLDTLTIDNCFTDWSGQAIMTGPHHRITLTASTALRCAVLFRPSGQPFYAFEPVSHPNNALHGIAPAMHILEPGQRLAGEMRLSLSAVPSSDPRSAA
ncbi:aldose 1-epimerase [Herbaspirillum huttiense]|uniref:aldose 1-epimerase n=1 Tax=Herbaspirillum huttiense TaxID=863372 RepID=UPI002E799E67|nr:aldose 1-epimerase [Herbaspirillum huttiense]MEE1637957.1 aldose 1-epimerase [Herbaspirillum huttiense NC40101]